MISNEKLYKLAPILSPSIYETIFFSQYQSRLDKNALILDEEIFRSCYIADNSYRVFLESNSNILKRAYFYLGVQQLYDSSIASIDFEEDSVVFTLNFKHIKELANDVIKDNSFAFKSPDFFIKIKFKNVVEFSINELDSKENLNSIEIDIKDSIYLQDQLTYIDDGMISIVISIKNTTTKSKDNIKYLVIKFGDIEIIENARDTWISIFPENLHILYDFFLNVKTKNTSCFEWGSKKMMNEYQKFIELLDE